MTTHMMNEAQRLTGRGLMVHPLTGPNATGNSPGKRPIKKDWQKQITPYNEKVMAEWWGADAKTDYNMGLVCGRASNVIVGDMDHMLFIDDLFDGIEIDTLRSARTKGRGHVFFKYDPSIKSQKHHDLGIEILSDGSNAVLPPSVHISGDVYHWADPDAPIQEMPDKLKTRLLALFDQKKRVVGLIRKCRPCFRKVWKDKADLHGADGREMMLAFCTELKANGAVLEDIQFVAKLIYGDNYDPERTDTEFKNVDEAKTWKCETIHDKLSGFVSDEQCVNCKNKQHSTVSGYATMTDQQPVEDDPDKPCKECRFFRDGINDKLQEWARCELQERFLNPYRLRSCKEWKPKPEKTQKRVVVSKEENGTKTALELLENKYDMLDVANLIRDIDHVEKVRPMIQGEDYIYKIHLHECVLIIPSKYMLSWRVFSQRFLEEFDEKPPGELAKVKIWDLFLKALKQENLIQVIDYDIEDDYSYEALIFLNELRNYKVVNNTDEYKMKKNILVKQGDHYYLPAGNVKKIKEKLNLKIPHKTLIELISIRYKCGDKSVRVAGVPTHCWELCNSVISDEILNITGNQYEEALK